MVSFPFSKNLKSFKASYAMITTHEAADIWRKIHNYPEFKKANAETQREFLLFVLEVMKQDLMIHMVSEIFSKDLTSDARTFPVSAVCDPVYTDVEILFGEEHRVIVARPYRAGKLIRTVSDIRQMGFHREMGCYEGEYYPELNLIHIKNGIHHSVVASILDKDGTAAARCDVYQLKDAYSHPKIDKSFSKWILDNGIEFPIAEPRFALLYELAKELQLGNVDSKGN